MICNQSIQILLSFCTVIQVIVCVVSQNCDARHNTNYCQNPIIDPNFDPVWLNDHYPTTGAPFLLGNEAFRTHYVQFLKGKDIVPAEEDYSGLCAKTVHDFNGTKVGGHYEGFGNLTFIRNCTNIKGDLTCEFISRANPNYKLSAKVFVSYFGTKNENHYLIVIYCLDNKKVAWSLGSLLKIELREIDFAKAMRHLDSRGFNTKDVVSLFNKDCVVS